MSSKSANYTCFNNSAGNGLLLLCEAELGDPMQKLRQARSNAATTAKQQGMASTLGIGHTFPKKWMDASAVHPSLKGVNMVGLFSSTSPALWVDTDDGCCTARSPGRHVDCGRWFGSDVQ